jgi:hypothetical protein
VTRRTTKHTPIIRTLIQITKPKITLRVIRRRERNRRKSTIRSRPPTSNRRPLKIKIKARSQRIRKRTTITIHSYVFNTSSSKTNRWLADTGATDHITYDKSRFLTYTEILGLRTISTVNGDTRPEGLGTIDI